MSTAYPPEPTDTSSSGNFDDSNCENESPTAATELGNVGNDTVAQFDFAAWSATKLIEQHAREMHDSAVSPFVAAAAGLVTITHAEDLPESLAWVAKHEGALPGWLRPFVEVDGSPAVQFKPGTPVEVSEGRPAKYVNGNHGQSPQLPVLRDVEGTKHVLVVEGTKQGLAAMSHAEPRWAVYGLAGIQGWIRDGVPCAALQGSRFKGANVVIVPDADAASNVSVYDGAVKLGQAFETAGAASVRFVALSESGASGKAGLDDYLARVPDAERSNRLTRLIERAGKKPASKKPAPAKTLAPAARDGRVQVNVNGERGEVLRQLSDALLDKAGGRTLFSSGSDFVMAAGSPLRLQSVRGGDLLRAISDHVVCYGMTGNDKPAYRYPDQQTMSALGTFHKDFPIIEGIATLPVVHEDGTIVSTNGYDALTRQFVWIDEALVGMNVPSSPTDEDVSRAVGRLDDIFQDFAIRNAGDRASLFALVLTALLRPSVPTAPLFLVNGLQPGVGKGLLANVVTALVTGLRTPMTPWPGSETELQKILMSALSAGSTFFVLDEVSELSSSSLNSLLTTARMGGRKLGETHQLELPNRMLSMALGNNVIVPGDMARRVFPIRLEWPEGSPETRSGFAHDDLVQYVLDHRRELVEAALTMIRAYFDRGCPVAEMPFRFGSFEAWQRLVGGVLAVSGVEGFLSNTIQDRASANTDDAAWSDFFAWIVDTFGNRTFLARDCTDAMMTDPDAPWPPDFSLEGTSSSKSLGKLLAKFKGRPHGHFRLLEAGVHKNNKLWFVEDSSGGEPTKPVGRVSKVASPTAAAAPAVAVEKVPVADAPKRVEAPTIAPASIPKTKTMNLPPHVRAAIEASPAPRQVRERPRGENGRYLDNAQILALDEQRLREEERLEREAAESSSDVPGFAVVSAGVATYSVSDLGGGQR